VLPRFGCSEDPSLAARFHACHAQDSVLGMNIGILKNMLPLRTNRLVYYQGFLSLTEAEKAEKYIKGKKRLEDYADHKTESGTNDWLLKSKYQFSSNTNAYHPPEE
jgi:hypothetical protein